MTPLQRGLALALVHVVLASGVAAKYVLDRERYPRVWVPTTGFDPDAPIRGRYVQLSLVPRFEGESDEPGPVRLAVRDGELVAQPISRDEPQRLHVWADGRSGLRALQPPVPFFLPEHARDPTAREETLWMEVTVPPEGVPRPLRLGVKRGDSIEPIAP